MKTGMVRDLEKSLKKEIAAEPKSEKPVQKKGVEKYILHIDMDAFFAAVEIRDNPSLKGKPIIVGASPNGRGVVTTCSYEARAFGIHSGMPGSEAAKLCPHGIFLKPQGDKYVHASIEIMKILRIFSNHVEPYSIDEAFLDITESLRMFGGPKQLAETMRQKIRDTLNLTGSVGIGPNRLVAKMASRMQKPDGLTIILKEKVQEIFDPLPVRDLIGVGPSTEASLERFGIHTLEQLRKTSPSMMKRHFGVGGKALINMAQGKGECKVEPLEHKTHEKSMGHEHTFGEDTMNPEKIHAQLMYLSEKVARRLRAAEFVGKRVTLKLRTTGFITTTHQMTIANSTNDQNKIHEITVKLLHEVWDNVSPVRLLGVSISKLRKDFESGCQTELFNQRSLYYRKILSGVIDGLKDRFCENSIGSASGFFLM